MRPVWKGALSFGLVNIPVRMYSAAREKELSFVLLHKKDLSQVRYARICKAEEKEVPWEEIVKGYEYEKGDFVVIKDEDFEKANLKKTKSVEIVSFAEGEEIDSLYYVKPYFLEPEKGAEKAYSLLRGAQALQEGGTCPLCAQESGASRCSQSPREYARSERASLPERAHRAQGVEAPSGQQNFGQRDRYSGRAHRAAH